MNLTIADIAKLAEGDLKGDASAKILAAAPIEKAGGNDLTFLADAAGAPAALASRAGCLLPSAHRPGVADRAASGVTCPHRLSA